MLSRAGPALASEDTELSPTDKNLCPFGACVFFFFYIEE